MLSEPSIQKVKVAEDTIVKEYEENKGHMLKQVRPLANDEETKGFDLGYERDINLINVYFKFKDKGKAPFELLMTADQIKLLKDIGTLEVDEVKYEFDEPSLVYQEEAHSLICNIKLKEKTVKTSYIKNNPRENNRY